MGQKNAIFDAFDAEFDDELAALDGTGDQGLFPQPPAEDTPPPVDVDAPQKDASPEDVIFGLDNDEFQERIIPAITIQAFCETDETRLLIERAGDDRRLSRTSLTVQEGGLAAATEYLRENPTPNLLLLESRAPAAQLIAEIDSLAEHCDEGVEVMVIGAMNDIQLYRQLVARGVSEYLVPPLQPLQLIKSIGELFADPDQPFLGRSIAVVGAKGGVGASTIAHNLAWSLAENASLNTTLVDLDLSFGTTALDFNEENAQTVADALRDPDRADDAVIGRLMSKFTPRLSLFTAPASLSSHLDIPTTAYDAVIEGVRRNVPYVVLDLPHLWSDWMETTLLNSNEVIVVCQPDLASLRNGKNIIDRLKDARPNDAPPKLVMNMAGVPKRPEIPVKDFAAAIGVEPEIILPFEPQLFGTAANNGQMISETDPNNKASLAVDHLASVLTGKSVQPPEKSLIQKLLGK
ncbi:MAG: AAA family ATPase [Pseudomonadota bacterium]